MKTYLYEKQKKKDKMEDETVSENEEEDEDEEMLSGEEEDQQNNSTNNKKKKRRKDLASLLSLLYEGLEEQIELVKQTSSEKQFYILQSYAPIACKECRHGHRKCDKALPICSNCLRKGKQCIFPESKRNRKSKPPIKKILTIHSDGRVTLKESNDDDDLSITELTLKSSISSPSSSSNKSHEKKEKQKRNKNHAEKHKEEESDEEEEVETYYHHSTNGGGMDITPMNDEDNHISPTYKPSHKRIELTEKKVFEENIKRKQKRQMISLIQLKENILKEQQLEEFNSSLTLEELHACQQLCLGHCLMFQINNLQDFLLVIYKYSFMKFTGDIQMNNDINYQSNFNNMTSNNNNSSFISHNNTFVKQPKTLHVDIPLIKSSNIDYTSNNFMIDSPTPTTLTPTPTSIFLTWMNEFDLSVMNNKPNEEISLIDLGLIYSILCINFQKLGHKEITNKIYTKLYNLIEKEYINFKKIYEQQSNQDTLVGNLMNEYSDEELFHLHLSFAYTSLFLAGEGDIERAKEFLLIIVNYLKRLKNIPVNVNLLILITNRIKLLICDSKEEYFNILLELHSTYIKFLLDYFTVHNFKYKLFGEKELEVDVISFLINTMKKSNEYKYLNILKGTKNETSFWVDYLTISLQMLKQNVTLEECFERLKLAKDFINYCYQSIYNIDSLSTNNTITLPKLLSNMVLINSLIIIENLKIELVKLIENYKIFKMNSYPFLNSSFTVQSAYNIIEFTRTEYFQYAFSFVLPPLASALEIHLQELEVLRSTQVLNSFMNVYQSNDDILDSEGDELLDNRRLCFEFNDNSSQILNHNVKRVKQYLQWGLEALTILQKRFSIITRKYTNLMETIKKELLEEEVRENNNNTITSPMSNNSIKSPLFGSNSNNLMNDTPMLTKRISSDSLLSKSDSEDFSIGIHDYYGASENNNLKSNVSSGLLKDMSKDGIDSFEDCKY
ncbi:hypothetical protein ABK040_006821 [Willaertia magna]